MNERLDPRAAAAMARAIEEAGGREVSFVADVGDGGVIVSAGVVARGTVDCVLALPGVASRGQMLLHNHPSGVLEPSVADLNVAARLHDGGIGFGIINNVASELYVVVEVPKPRRRQGIDPVAAAGLLSEGGALAAQLRLLEDRPSQRHMVAHVADTYNEGGIALLEAGTGVGKSFAYLVPAILWALANDERTVVSTNTINLQEQLVGKDLPLLGKALGTDSRPVRWALLKGWHNYLCKSRLDHAKGHLGTLLEPHRQDELDAIQRWARATSDGSRSDLSFMPSPEVWDEVAAEPDLCGRIKCKHFDKCFVFEARRRAADADVVVVNHHLLASDLAVRHAQGGNWDDAAVLPPYRRLILDEGHHLEDTAAEHLGKRASSRGVERLLSRLERNNKGVLPSLRQAMSAELDDRTGPPLLERLATRTHGALASARVAVSALFAELDGWLGNRPDTTQRLSDAFAEDPAWEGGLDAALEGFHYQLGRLREELAGLTADLDEADENLSERLSALCAELRAIAARIDGARDAVQSALRPAPGAPASVRWLERRNPGNVAMATAPLDLAPLLQEILFERVETIVITSATLASGGSFGFLENRLGLNLPPVRAGAREVLPSPFDFREQCLFVIPDDAPEPAAGSDAHDSYTADVAAELAEYSDGGMFVLFTSYRSLKRVAGLLRERRDVVGRWPLLAQGDGPRDIMLRRFRESGSSILLGTDSFWEGVDVPGHALRALVLAKLPFKVPTEPITAARLEAIEAAGGDAFNDYQVPLAGLKLKQGFGRLIRTRTDVGVVVLLDPRVIRKRYGAALLAGLPPARRVVGPWDVVRDDIAGFFAMHMTIDGRR